MASRDSGLCVASKVSGSWVASSETQDLGFVDRLGILGGAALQRCDFAASREGFSPSGFRGSRSDAMRFRRGVFAVLGRRTPQTGHVSAGTHVIVAREAGRAQMKLMYFALNHRRLASAKIATTSNSSRRLRLAGRNIFLQETSFQIKTCRYA